MTHRPRGDVDPSDPRQVADVLAMVHQDLGVGGVGDLLGRLPSSRTVPGTRGGLFRSATPPSVWLSPEHQIVLSDPPLHVHVVGGVVLARDPLPAGRLPDTIGRLLVAVTEQTGTQQAATVVLTAARETAQRWR